METWARVRTTDGGWPERATGTGGVRLFVCPVLRQQGGGGWLSTEVIQESFKKLEKKDCMLRHIAVVQYAVNSK